MDYHYDYSPREVQRQRFREQISIARDLHLPIVIHTREAQTDTIRILQEEHAAEVGGVFHCFSGDSWLAKDALDLGFNLSFSGIITFQNATMLREIVQSVPEDRLMIETDAPYLSPVPFRGRRNESAYVRYVAEKIAELKGGSLPSAFETYRISHHGEYETAIQNFRKFLRRFRIAFGSLRGLPFFSDLRFLPSGSSSCVLRVERDLGGEVWR